MPFIPTYCSRADESCSAWEMKQHSQEQEVGVGQTPLVGVAARWSNDPPHTLLTHRGIDSFHCNTLMRARSSAAPRFERRAAYLESGLGSSTRNNKLAIALYLFIRKLSQPRIFACSIVLISLVVVLTIPEDIDAVSAQLFLCVKRLFGTMCSCRVKRFMITVWKTSCR